jgi:ribosomal protein S18 acetylase RimI-like enzyme
MLSVRQNNPAWHLYELMGFKAVDTALHQVGSTSFVMLLRFH